MEYSVYISLRGGYLPNEVQAFTRLSDARAYAGELRRAITVPGERFVVETPLKRFTRKLFNTLYGGAAYVYGYWPETNEEIVISGWK